MIIRPYQVRERVGAVQPYDPTAVNVVVATGQRTLEEQRKRDLEQRDSDATIGMLNVETNINKRLVDTQKQLDENGQINGVNYPDIASQIRVDEYKDFTPPPELKNKYNEQQAVYQARQALTSHGYYSTIKEEKIKADFKKTYSDIAILTTRETADENIEKITLLVDGMTLSGTQRNLLLTSSIQGHNNQMYRNDINNPDNNVERLEFQYKEFKKNKYSVGVENHKTIDKLFISKIKTKKMANVAFDKTQKKYQREQTITLFEMCSNIDSVGEGCDFKPYVKDLEYTRRERENFKDFENVQKPLRPLFINMAGGYSAEIDEVRSKLERNVADENLSTFTRDNSKKKLAYMDKQRSQFETKIRQPDGIDFIIAQLNKGDNTDIMRGAERLSAEWMGKANSLMARLGLSEQERILLPREMREQLVTKPFDTVENILAIAEQGGWDDTTRRVAIKEINKVTGLPKGTSILLTQDSTKGTRALKDYKNNKELYEKSDPDTKLNTYWPTDLTREKLRLSGLPAEDLTRFDSAVEIQALSTWELTGGDMDDVFENTYQEIIDKDFTFSSDKINGGQLRFDSSKVSQNLADDYELALSYIIDEPEILDELVFWQAIEENYDKEEVYDLISDARVVSINNDTEFKLLNGFIIPLNKSMTWERAKEIYDKHVTELRSNPSLRLNL